MKLTAATNYNDDDDADDHDDDAEDHDDDEAKHVNPIYGLRKLRCM